MVPSGSVLRSDSGVSGRAASSTRRAAPMCVVKNRPCAIFSDFRLRPPVGGSCAASPGEAPSEAGSDADLERVGVADRSHRKTHHKSPPQQYSRGGLKTTAEMLALRPPQNKWAHDSRIFFFVRCYYCLYPLGWLG
jgi:hypothetical protein